MILGGAFSLTGLQANNNTDTNNKGTKFLMMYDCDYLILSGFFEIKLFQLP